MTVQNALKVFVWPCNIILLGKGHWARDCPTASMSPRRHLSSRSLKMGLMILTSNFHVGIICTPLVLFGFSEIFDTTFNDYKIMFDYLVLAPLKVHNYQPLLPHIHTDKTDHCVQYCKQRKCACRTNILWRLKKLNQDAHTARKAKTKQLC